MLWLDTGSMDYVKSEGVSLRIHSAIIMATLLEGAFGSFFGLGFSSVMVWTPITIILAHSLSAMIYRREGIVPSPEFTVILALIYFLVIWRFTTFFWTSDYILSLKESVKTLYLFVFIASIYYVMTHTTRERILRMIAFVVTFGLLISVIAYMYQLLTEFGFANYAKRAVKMQIDIYYRANTAGGVVLLLGLWNWVLVFSGKKYMKIGLFNLMLTLFLLFGIASYASLGGFMASMSVVLFYTLYVIRGRMLLFYFSNLACLGLAFFSIYFVIVSTTIETLSTANGRIGIWIEALEVFREGHWIAGIGSGAAKRIMFSTNYESIDLHNLLIYSLANGGIIELALVLFFFIWLTGIAIFTKKGTGMVLIAFIIGAFFRNQAESGGIIFGNLNSSWIFLSWYVLITIIVLTKDGTFQRHGSGRYKSVKST